MSRLLLVLAMVPQVTPSPSTSPDIKVPPGFSISMYSENPLGSDIYTLTIDDAGRVIVAGRGYVRVLVDDKGDGVANRAIDLIDGLKDGPMGLLAEGDSLYVVSEGGLQRYRGYNGKDKLKQPPETLVKLKTTGEHDAHMVRRGPDGWLYLLCGNAAGVSKAAITGSRSPVKEPVAGALLRISPDGKQVEVVCDGFRNPYSFDFNLDGEIFASDSDNERCVGLPWYEYCRFYHLIPGANYGWRTPQVGKFWRKPPYFLDCVPPVSYLGRGSPTGVACYRHSHFPESYWGGFFLADWTFGRIDFISLDERDSTYAGTPHVFAEAVGTSGFAPTGLAVHPKTGELFVSIGGRGTRGGVYRISHAKKLQGTPLPMAKHSLDWSEEAGKKWLVAVKDEKFGTSREQRARREALELILRHREHMSWGEPLFKSLKPDLSFPDPLIRIAAARAVDKLAIPKAEILSPEARIVLAYAFVKDDPDWAIQIAMDVLRMKSPPPLGKLHAIRLIQLAFGDLTAPGTAGTIWEGYSLANPHRLVPSKGLLALIRHGDERRLGVLRHSLVGDDARFHREVARTLAAFGEMDVSAAVGQITPDSFVESDLHYLATIARQTRDWMEGDTTRVVDWLIDYEVKANKYRTPRDQNWPLRLEEVLQALGKSNPKIAEGVLEHDSFGRPEHLLLVKPLGIPTNRAALRFIEAAKKDLNYAWTPGLVRTFEGLGLKKIRPLLKDLWEKPQLRDAIVTLLAADPDPADQMQLMAGLGSFDPEVVRVSALAVIKLATPSGESQIAAAIKALRRLAPEDKKAREAIVALLRHWSNQEIPAESKLWSEWAVKKYPGMQKLLAASDGFDAVAWKNREAGIAWDKGDPARGRLIFTKATCAACHDGARALGPSLQGVGKRFSRDDLLTAILEPSKDISPRYRATRFTTTDERTYTGMIVYEASDGVILLTGPDAVIRIPGDRIESKRISDVSLMPPGLIDKLTDTEIADLLAYLRSTEPPSGK